MEKMTLITLAEQLTEKITPDEDFDTILEKCEEATSKQLDELTTLQLALLVQVRVLENVIHKNSHTGSREYKLS